MFCLCLYIRFLMLRLVILCTCYLFMSLLPYVYVFIGFSWWMVYGYYSYNIFLFLFTRRLLSTHDTLYTTALLMALLCWCAFLLYYVFCVLLGVFLFGFAVLFCHCC